MQLYINNKSNNPSFGHYYASDKAIKEVAKYAVYQNNLSKIKELKSLNFNTILKNLKYVHLVALTSGLQMLVSKSYLKYLIDPECGSAEFCKSENEKTKIKYRDLTDDENQELNSIPNITSEDKDVFVIEEHPEKNQSKIISSTNDKISALNNFECGINREMRIRAELKQQYEQEMNRDLANIDEATIIANELINDMGYNNTSYIDKNDLQTNYPYIVTKHKNLRDYMESR